MDRKETSLSDLYSQAFETMQKAASLPRGDSKQSLYIDARRMFEQAMDMIESLTLFSDNEAIEDVATNDLKYLLVPAYLANIAISAECGPNRLETFTRAESLIIKFLQQALDYGLVDEDIERLIKPNKDGGRASVPRVTSLESAVQARNNKIERYKRMSLLEKRLKELNLRIKSGQVVDEEVTREFYISLYKKWIDDSKESLEKEVRPALFFEQNRPKESRQPSSSNSRMSSPKTSNVITIVKDELHKQVFGIGYPSRPTVTVDEFISKKINDGDLAFHAQKEVYANSLQRYAEQPNLLRDQEELSDEEREEKEEKEDVEELRRKRQWDEFKDINPRGSGNRYNMG